MELISDILLAAGALGAGLYCFVLSRRLTRFTDLENGVGGAVAVLSAQVDDLSKTLETAQAAAGASSESLMELTVRGEDVARRLELLVASMHDLPGEPVPQPGPVAASAVVAPDAAAARTASQTGGEPVFVRHPRNGSTG